MKTQRDAADAALDMRGSVHVNREPHDAGVHAGAKHRRHDESLKTEMTP
jgi:hypothetical protein